MRCLATTIACALVWAAPALASTVPPLDLREGEHSVSVGLLAASLDAAVLDRLSVGGTVLQTVGAIHNRAAARVMWRALEFDNGVHLGAVFSAGYYTVTEIHNALGPLRTQAGTFFHPALGFAWTGAGGQGRVRLRGTWGLPLLLPTYTPPYPWSAAALLGLNAEVGFLIADNQEVFLGGDSLLGWRGRF